MPFRFRFPLNSRQPNINRRRLLAGALAAPFLFWLPGRADGRSIIHQLEGDVFVNGRKTSVAGQISAGDRIVVAYGGSLAMSLDGDAFLVREGTVLELVGKGILSGMRLVTGALLSVFAKRHQPAYLVTSVATIGIRGTGLYLGATPHRLYACTCYGQTEIHFGNHVEQVRATHHSAHEISPDQAGLMGMKSMSVVDHTDDELRMLEGYVGRKPEFDL